MANEWTLGFRCARVGRAVEAPAGDDVVLLRAARTLKTMHGQLTCAVLEQFRAGARPRHELIHASASLDQMERELRDILLGYGGFSGRELRERVRRAFFHCQDVVVMLETPAFVEMLETPAPIEMLAPALA